MSKIEDALRKAQIVRGTKGPQSAPAGGRQLIRSQNTQIIPLDSRNLALNEIARMVDTDLMGKQELAESRTIFPDMRDSRIVDAFRELRTRLIQKNGAQNMVLMVTSVTARNGSTFVARNLAVSFAFDESKTALLVDCNLRHPTLVGRSETSRTRGLTDYIESGDMPVEEIIYPVGIPRLRLIPSGAKREIPTEYFTSLKMRQLLDALKQRYAERYVILDAPAVTQSADTRILTELADYVLLVVPYGKVTESQIAAAARAVGAQKLVGVVFNNEPRISSFVRGMSGDKMHPFDFSWLTKYFSRRTGA